MGRSISTVTAALGEHLPDENTWKAFVSGLMGPHGWTTTRIFGSDGSIKGTAKWYVDPFCARCAIRVTDKLGGMAVELPFRRTDFASATTVANAGGLGTLYHGSSATPWHISATSAAATLPGIPGDLVTFTLFFADALGTEA